jgi:hypothetical protein
VIKGLCNEVGSLRACSTSIIIAVMMEAERASETSANLYQTTGCYDPEDSHLHTRHRQNLKSCLLCNVLKCLCANRTIGYV